MGEARRRRDLGLPPREMKKKSDDEKASFLSNLSAKYPFLPFSVFFSLGGNPKSLLLLASPIHSKGLLNLR